MCDGTGATCFRSFEPVLHDAHVFAAQFTIYNYDRRGRSDSGNTLPYAVEREVEDIEAIIDASGGTAYVYGHSSGAILALEAAMHLGGKVRKLVMYDPAYASDDANQRALTELRDALAAERCRLPMVEVIADYRFTAADGNTRTLLDMFEGRHQLIVDHYMFDPSWDEGCMSCAGRVDQYGNIAHLHERDTTIAVVSRAPIAKIEPFKRKMGWTFPWYSSFGSRFNFDFGVSFDATVENPTYNYRPAAAWEAQGMPAPAGELHGTSVLLRDSEHVFHTYSTYGRGTEQVGGTHYYLDMTALGRQEDWEEPKGRMDAFQPRADQPEAGQTAGRG